MNLTGSNRGIVVAGPARRGLTVDGMMRFYRQFGKTALVFMLVASAYLAHAAGLISLMGERFSTASASIAGQMGMVVRTVDVDGSYMTSHAAIEEALGLNMGASILTVNLAEKRAAVEALPWVQTAVLSRHFPDVLKVEITERQPYAIWQVFGELWLIDAAGAQITSEGLGRYADLPFIVGEGAPEAYTKLAEAFASDPQFTSRITAAVRVGERRWDLTFDTGARLRLPEETTDYGPTLAWQRFSKMERDHQLLSREVAIYDMRLPDRMVVSLTDEGKARIGEDEDERNT